MDLNNNGAFLAKNDNFGDTTLCLDGFGYGGNSRSSPDDGCKLVLGLGPTPKTYSDDYNPVRVNKPKVSASGFQPDFASDGDSILKLGLSRGSGEIFSKHDGKRVSVPLVDEGSTSAKKSGGYMRSLLLAPRRDSTEVRLDNPNLLDFSAVSHFQPSQLSSEPSAATDYSIGATSEGTPAVTSSDQGTHISKKCKFVGCLKGPRGASGLCIGHGGGQRCQKSGCSKGAESRTAYCKSHGGGKRCQQLGCTKSAEGKTDHCIAHGGGRRCSHPGGCTKAARGKSGLCIRHGGGKRCQIDGCSRSAEGQAGLCISHGGGKRCHYQDCTKGAQGSTMFCKAHGGGKRCVFAGCTKGAEGSTPLCKGHGGGKRCLFDGGGICPKSVHGGTNFCVAHGGGKRCVVSGCTKSARGRTDCCVRHGGGKRCRLVNCEKSAQGSTDFCKAHGGGKRCVWEDGKCEKFSRGKSGLCAAHSSMVQTSKGGMIGPSLFHGVVASASTVGSNFDNNYSSSGVSVSECIDSPEKPPKRRNLIPPQVLVPLSMKSLAPRKSFDVVISEGRVHGGDLISLLGGNMKNVVDGT